MLCWDQRLCTTAEHFLDYKLACPYILFTRYKNINVYAPTFFSLLKKLHVFLTEVLESVAQECKHYINIMMYLNPWKLSTCLTMRCEGRDDPNLNTSHSYVASWVAPTLKPASLIAKIKRRKKKACRIREVNMNSHANTAKG